MVGCRTSRQIMEVDNLKTMSIIGIDEDDVREKDERHKRSQNARVPTLDGLRLRASQNKGTS